MVHFNITIDLERPIRKKVNAIRKLAFHTHLQVDMRAFSQDNWHLLKSRFPNAKVREMEFRMHHFKMNDF